MNLSIVNSLIQLVQLLIFHKLNLFIHQSINLPATAFLETETINIFHMSQFCNNFEGRSPTMLELHTSSLVNWFSSRGYELNYKTMKCNLLKTMSWI